VGQRIKDARERAGLSRPVLAGLIGMSTEWLKRVENGRIQTPRLEMLAQIADALGMSDVAELTGNGFAVPVSVYAGPRHAALGAVQAALTDYRITPAAQPPNIEHLGLQLANAWRVRHSSSDHRTQLGALLPSLIRDAQQAARTTEGEQRRDARRVLAGVYALTDFYVAYQPSPELVWMVADRSLTEGQEADDPYATAGGAWAMVQALRDSGRWEEAIALADDAAGQLAPYLENAPDDWRGMVGALEAEIAYVWARRGRHGEAWARWERAEQVARQLGPSYRHVQSSFSLPVIKAHAVTLGVELRHPGEALRHAEAFEPADIASVPRRSRHLIEVARAYHQRDERVASWAMLSQSARAAIETIRYNGYAREMLVDLRSRPPTGLAADVTALCEQVGIAA
jgi:transcriptional regulator with XRE-family HTH domain